MRYATRLKGDYMDQKICAICSTVASPDSIKCPVCGWGIFETEKYHEPPKSIKNTQNVARRSGMQDWSVERLKLELDRKIRELREAEKEKEKMYSEMDRNRNENPSYWNHGEGAGGGVAPDMSWIYRQIQSLEKEIGKIEDELRRRY